MTRDLKGSLRLLWCVSAPGGKSRMKILVGTRFPRIQERDDGKVVKIVRYLWLV